MTPTDDSFMGLFIGLIIIFLFIIPFVVFMLKRP